MPRESKREKFVKKAKFGVAGALGKFRALRKNRKISACYVFGSYLKNPGKARDIDVCVISSGMSSAEMARIAMEFEKPVDVSFMERMPYYIAINVLREGKPIFIRDKCAFAKKWREVVGKHLAYRCMRQRIYEGVAKWMKSKTRSIA